MAQSSVYLFKFTNNSKIQFLGIPSSVQLAHPYSNDQETLVDCYRLPEQPLLGNSKPSTNVNQKNKSGLENG